MNISSTAIRPQAKRPVEIAKKEAPAPQESTTFSSGDGVGWGDAIVGLGAGVVSGVVTGVGTGLASVKHSLVGTGEAYKALYKNETVGPWLKTALGAVMPIATITVPALAALGGTAVGMYQGFVEGATNGFASALSKSFETVSDFNKEWAPALRNEIREFGDEKLREGEERFDISPIRGAESIIAGAGNTVVGAVGFGGSTITQIPEAFVTANKAINQSDMGLPLRTVSHAISAPLAVLAAPLGVVGGAVAGLVSGVAHGYQDGLVESFKKTTEYVGDYHEFVDKGLAEMAEELVKDPPKN